MEVVLAIVDPGSAEAQWAMGRYFAELDERFPEGFDPGDALTAALDLYAEPAGAFVLATRGDEVVGCGAVTHLDGARSEIKRMWVSPSARGAGLARRLLARLEHAAATAGRTIVVLDTAGALREAIALYGSAGYVSVAAYNDNPYAEHWFEKALEA